MVDALGGLLDGGKVKLYCVPSFDSESWTRDDLPLEERARRHGHYEWWVLTRLVPFVQADSHSAELDRDGRVVRRLPRRELLPEARRPLPGRDRHERRLRRDGPGRRRARRRRLLQQPDGLRREPRAATISTGSRRTPRSSSSAARGSGRTRRARSSRRRGSVRFSPRRASGTRWISGDTTCRTTGRRGGGRSRIICRGLSEHVIGLLLGTEEDWPAAFEALVSRLGKVDGDDAAHRADPQRAVRPALEARTTRS